jgi:hypothetical protein
MRYRPSEPRRTKDPQSDIGGVVAMWAFTIAAVGALVAFTWGGVMVPHSDKELAAADSVPTRRPAEPD